MDSKRKIKSDAVENRSEKNLKSINLSHLQDYSTVVEYEQMINASNSLVFYATPTGVVEDCNDRVKATLGYKKEELLGNHLFRIIDPDEHQDALEYFQTLKTDRTQEKTFRFVHTKGHLLHMQVHASYLQHAENHIGDRIICVIQDVTGTRSLERRLANQELMLRAIFNNTHFDLFLINKDGLIEVANYKGMHTFNNLDRRITGNRIGNVIGCINAGKQRNQCSFTKHCKNCKVLQSINTSLRSQRTVEETVELHLHKEYTSGDRRHMVISTTYIDTDPEPMVLVTLNDTTQIEKIRDRSSLFAELIDHSKDAMFVLNDRLRIVETNKEARDSLLYSEQELLRKRLPDILCVPDKWKLLRHLFLKISIEQKAVFETYHLRSDGTSFPVEVSATQYKENRYFLAIVRDISERKKREEELRSSEKQYRELIHNIQSAVAVYKPIENGQYFGIVNLNQEACRITGLSVQDVKGKKVTEALPGIIKAGLQRALQRVNLEGEARKLPMKYYSDIRISFWAEHYIYKLPSGFIVHVFNDKTEYVKKVEQEKILKELQNNSQDAIFILDAHTGLFIDTNRTALRTLGYTRKEMMHMNLLDIEKTIDGAEQFLAHVTRLKESNGLLIRGIHRKKSGEEFPVEMSSKIITFKNREYIMTIARDITERVSAEALRMSAVAEAVEAEYKRFARDIHDSLGPLLCTIRLYIDNLKDHKNDPAKIKRRLLQTSQLIDQAIHTAREVSHNLAPQKLMTDGFLKTLKKFCAHIMKTSKLIIHINNHTKTPINPAYNTHLFRICTELINNTVKYAQAKQVSITVSESLEQLEIEYRDDGMGFDSDETIYDQSGLGLQGIFDRISLFNGTYNLKSASGKGMTLTFKLPL